MMMLSFSFLFDETMAEAQPNIGLDDKLHLVWPGEINWRRHVLVSSVRLGKENELLYHVPNNFANNIHAKSSFCGWNN